VTPNAATDECIYEADAVYVGILLFGSRICTQCDAELPRNTDYFKADATRAGGLRSDCRRCARSRAHDRYERDPQKKLAADRAYRTRLGHCPPRRKAAAR
jgi:hypothetical protein